ncbi:hypothetical protein Tco_0914037, partial [Tanacetum coccineum]
MSSAKIEQIVAQRVTNAIETIAIYETKIRMAYDSIAHVVRQGAKVVRNANNKRKWKGDYQNKTGQQNEQQKVVRAYISGLREKKAYAGNMPYCNKSNLCKGAILELKRRHLKKSVICYYTPYPTRK